MTRLRAFSALATLAVAFGLASCGSSASDEAKSTVQSYLDAFAKGDGKKACDLMSDLTRQQFVTRVKLLARTTSCSKAVTALKPVMAVALKGSKVTQVRVVGNDASATVRAGKRESTTVLHKENGKWKVTAGPGTQ
jgi:ketosteroid isomerase-like protein